MKAEFAEQVNDFQEESSDLLDAMEEALLQIQKEGMNNENISAVFRAAHTIKGAGGMFELDYLVKFTHVAENLLDEIRKKHIVMSDPIINMFFEVKDHLQALVQWAIDNEGSPESNLEATSDFLAQQLNYYLNGGDPQTVFGQSLSPTTSVAIDSPVVTQEEEKVETSHEETITPATHNEAPHFVAPSSRPVYRYKLYLRFVNHSFAHGIDPVEFLKTLKIAGTISELKTDMSSVPDLLNFDPSQTYFVFDMMYESTKSKEEIEQIFESAKEYCQASITPLETLSQEVQTPILPSVAPLTIEQTPPAPVQPAMTIQSEIVVPSIIPSTPIVKPVADKEPTIKTSASLRVEAHKIDTLINLIGEMVIANSNVVQKIATKGDKDLIESISVVSRMLEEIREASMQTRMVPIGETFSRFKRIVRDLSKDLGKDIELEIIGGETELDKTVTEKISDPLIHLVRNSLDHGIEMPETRKASGKPATGQLILKAFHEAGSIAIQIVDDGKGLDPAVLRAKAIEKGIIDADEVLSEKETLNLIMAAGFSTAEKISNISGRGVGMDVVRRNIEELRGTIELDSVVGKGTTITIRLPLTLAIIDGFLTRVGDTFYVVPLDMIVECIELTSKQVNEMKENNYINLRGSILPILDLREYFETKHIPSKRENIVIVRFASQTVGLIVNELHGEFQTVIKPLGPVFRNVRSVGGATILGSGEVAMILDIPMLLQSINKISNDG